MNRTEQQKKIEYFVKYAGFCLEIWNSIIGQEITHKDVGLGTIVGIDTNNGRIDVIVKFASLRGIRKYNTQFLPRTFTQLTLPGDVERDLETHYWNFKIEDLLNQLRNLASQPSINQSTFNTFEAIHNQLMWHQPRQLPAQTIQEINEYRQKFMNKKQKQIDRKRFFDLSAKAMNPNVATRFSLPKLYDSDLRLVEKWGQSSQGNLNRDSLIKAKIRDSELDRLLSARSAEKIAADFYRQYEKKVKDISITQIDANSEPHWKKYDLDVDDIPTDVKNSRQSPKNRDRYTEHYIQKKFSYNKESQDVTIAGVLSPYLWTFELLDKPVEHHQNREIQFLGETTWTKLQVLKNEFKNRVYFDVPNPTGEYLLPPWVFEYPKYVYTERDKTLKELNGFTNLDSLRGTTFEFNPIPVCIAAGINLAEISDNGILANWERNFLNQLRNRVKKYGLSLPFIFLTILAHFCNMAMYSKETSNFEPNKYRQFLFFKETHKPLGIYDPLQTIRALIEALNTLWTTENELIRQFRKFKLQSSNILQAKRNSDETLWTTLIAYCGGRSEDGRACGKNPLVLGESEPCKYGKLKCPDCGFCCPKCKGADQLEVLENV